MNTEYPKIETLFDRDPETFKVIPDEQHIRCEEFRLVNRWLLTEKIDGTNIRIHLTGGKLHFLGRTDKAQMQPNVQEALDRLFPSVEAVAQAFDPDTDDAVLYGEAYGPKVQKGGGNYRGDVSFRLFDVRFGHWWVNWANVEDIARKLGIETVPVLGSVGDFEQAVVFTRNLKSHVAHIEGGNSEVLAEGVVARTDPLMLQRSGQRVMWKLKSKDF